MFNRCSVCDWNAAGMCANYEIDKFLSKGQRNQVVLDKSRGILLCLKCLNAIGEVKYDYVKQDQAKEEGELPLLLEDFSDHEIRELEEAKDIILDSP